MKSMQIEHLCAAAEAARDAGNAVVIRAETPDEYRRARMRLHALLDPATVLELLAQLDQGQRQLAEAGAEVMALDDGTMASAEAVRRTRLDTWEEAAQLVLRVNLPGAAALAATLRARGELVR